MFFKSGGSLREGGQPVQDTFWGSKTVFLAVFESVLAVLPEIRHPQEGVWEPENTYSRLAGPGTSPGGRSRLGGLTSSLIFSVFGVFYRFFVFLSLIFTSSGFFLVNCVLVHGIHPAMVFKAPFKKPIMGKRKLVVFDEKSIQIYEGRIDVLWLKGPSFCSKPRFLV